MKVLPVPSRLWHGNDLYPLPPNYLEILQTDPEAARQVRVNSCRQWLLPRKTIMRELMRVVPDWTTMKPADQQALVEEYKGEAFVACIEFFDKWYLHPDPDVDFDPMFYDEVPLPTPQFHFDIWRDWAMYPASLAVAPRGGAKSMCIRKGIMMTMLTCPVYKVIYCSSSQKNCTESASMIRFQLYNNPRIQEDWAPEMPTKRIRPRRSEGQTGIEWFNLSNGSQLVTYSANSKMRGGRPRWFALDDPEFDPSASTSMAILRDYMHRLIFKVAMPMLSRRECRLTWTATFVSRRHLAWQAMEMEKGLVDGEVKARAKIPEFEFWQRRTIKACWLDENGRMQSCWKEMWPVNEAEKVALGLDPSTKTLEEIEKRIGRANFNSEYLANPGSSEEAFFKIDETQHGFTVGEVDDAFLKDPWKSSAVFYWQTGEERKSSPVKDFLATARLFITMDTSKTAKPGSDFKVATLMAVNKDHDLFVLDMWAGRASQDVLAAEAFKLAQKWRCRLIAPEEVEDGIVLVRSMKNHVQRLAALGTPMESLPVVKGFNPGYTQKVTKISALSMRFDHGKIKLPFYLKHRKPWVDLFDQIHQFNPEADDGGLQHDDHLDTVSMSEYVTGSRSPRQMTPLEATKDVIELLKQGQKVSEDGVPLTAYLDLGKLSPEQLTTLIDVMGSGRPGGGSVL